MQARELEEAAQEVQVEALVKALEQVALGEQAVQGQEAPVAAVVAVAAAEVEQTLQETLQETPTKAESVAVMTMTTLRMTQTKSPRRILQREGAHDRNRVNHVAAELAKVASNPE